jgi:hypothetical protein
VGKKRLIITHSLCTSEKNSCGSLVGEASCKMHEAFFYIEGQFQQFYPGKRETKIVQIPFFTTPYFSG